MDSNSAKPQELTGYCAPEYRKLPVSGDHNDGYPVGHDGHRAIIQCPSGHTFKTLLERVPMFTKKPLPIACPGCTPAPVVRAGYYTQPPKAPLASCRILEIDGERVQDPREQSDAEAMEKRFFDSYERPQEVTE